jgi:hypothetical protein
MLMLTAGICTGSTAVSTSVSVSGHCFSTAATALRIAAVTVVTKVALLLNVLARCIRFTLRSAPCYAVYNKIMPILTVRLHQHILLILAVLSTCTTREAISQLCQAVTGITVTHSTGSLQNCKPDMSHVTTWP